MADETVMTKVVAMTDRWMPLEVVNRCIQFEHVFGELGDDKRRQKSLDMFLRLVIEDTHELIRAKVILITFLFLLPMAY